MFTWGPQQPPLALLVSAPGTTEFETEQSFDGPTITAPATNSTPVSWSFASDPTGLVPSVASGSLAPGASITPTLSAAAAAVYAATVSNTSGGTVNGASSAAPGNGGEFTITSSGPPPPPPPPPPSPFPALIGEVDFTNKNSGLWQSSPTSYANTTFDGAGSMRFGLYSVPRNVHWMNTEPACDFLGFPGAVGCDLGWNAEGGSVDVTDGPDGLLDGSLYMCGLEVEFQQEFRPLDTTDVELDVLFYYSATESWGIRMSNKPSDKSLSILQDGAAVSTFPLSLTDGKSLHTMRLELGGYIGEPDEYEVRVYWDDTLIGSEELSHPPSAIALSGARVRFLVLYKNNNGQLINLRKIRTTDWGG